MQRLSLRELARRLDRDKSGLSRLAARGVIPKGGDGKFDEAEVRRALATNLDPGRRKAVSPEQRNAPSQSTVNALPATGPFPAPAAYRTRADLPDDFARGALFAAHAMAYGLPTAVACAALEVGAEASTAVKAYAFGQEDAVLLVAGICEDLGLKPSGSDENGPHPPTAFGGFDPNMPLAELAA